MEPIGTGTTHCPGVKVRPYCIISQKDACLSGLRGREGELGVSADKPRVCVGFEDGLRKRQFEAPGNLIPEGYACDTVEREAGFRSWIVKEQQAYFWHLVNSIRPVCYLPLACSFLEHALPCSSPVAHHFHRPPQPWLNTHCHFPSLRPDMQLCTPAWLLSGGSSLNFPMFLFCCLSWPGELDQNDAAMSSTRFCLFAFKQTIKSQIFLPSRGIN